MTFTGPVRRGIRDALPLVAPIAAFAAVFGALAVQAGLSTQLTIFTSLIVVSGAAQIAMVGLLAAGPGPVLVATLGLALRHLPMSASLSEKLGDVPWWRRLHLAWILVDESYGLAISARERGETNLVDYKTAVDLMLYSTWLGFTTLGAIFGPDLDAARLGLEVIIPLFFLGLAMPMIRGRRNLFTALLALAATVGSIIWLPAAWQVTAAAVVGALLGSRVRTAGVGDDALVPK
ncbi:MAG: AzlC family ABC transporter permease [Actinomycetota bacterium]